jgi:hypothetical protein
MNGRVAKRIRKQIYGNKKRELVTERGYVELFGGTLVSTGKRKEYILAKKNYIT